ncbi:MAG: hypothetical protein IPK04_11035 [Bdellovibrionales bacterium]|jgi:hypothetical protein|nr:hypothetical protein [Bdellovibrionales bacterium]MBL7670666.1 hypothetical protein [Pseudobdellovibrionaceae bacterium]
MRALIIVLMMFVSIHGNSAASRSFSRLNPNEVIQVLELPDCGFPCGYDKK